MRTLLSTRARALGTRRRRAEGRTRTESTAVVGAFDVPALVACLRLDVKHGHSTTPEEGRR